MQDGATLEGYVASRRIRFDKFTHYALHMEAYIIERAAAKK